MEITSENFLNWMKFALKIYPLSKKDTFKLRRYLNRTDIVTRRKEIEDALGKPIEREEYGS